MAAQSLYRTLMLWLTKSTVRPPCTLAHLPEARLLELGVADREHLVDDEDFRLDVGRDREGQPHVHPAAVPLHRRVEELLHLGEGDDLVELASISARLMPRIAPLR